MRKKVRTDGNIRAAAVSALACIGALFVCVTLFSWLASKLDLSDAAVEVMAGISLSAGCFSGAFAAGNIKRRKGILSGIVFGGAVFMLLMLLGMIMLKSFSSDGIAAKAVLILCCSVSGGILGVNTKALFR